MRIAIIGAGWFGCHIGKSLLKKGIDVTVYEKDAELFNGASRYNTGRLHLGFHYPRSEKTRKQSKEGFELFINEYGDFSEKIEHNLYLVAEKKSLMDFGTYRSILESEDLDFKTIDPAEYGFVNVEGGLICREQAVNPIKAAEHFERVLAGHLRLNTPVNSLVNKDDSVWVNSEAYDYCINCSYYTFNPGVLSKDICYENVVSILMKPTRQCREKSYVIMDGDFFSVNPYYNTTDSYDYSLYHVNHSVVSSSSTYQEALAINSKISTLPFQQQLKWEPLMRDVLNFYPAFLEELNPVGSFLSIRTTLINKNASRECIVDEDERLINVLSGKINSIFEAEQRVSSILNI